MGQSQPDGVVYCRHLKEFGPNFNARVVIWLVLGRRVSFNLFFLRDSYNFLI